MATRKNFKKTGRKRIKPKGGAKKRKTVRGGGEEWDNAIDFLNTIKQYKNDPDQVMIKDAKTQYNYGFFKTYFQNYLAHLRKNDNKTYGDTIKLLNETGIIG